MRAYQLTAIRFSALAATFFLGGSAEAGSIPLGSWLEFSFTTAGTQAKGCDPADAAGAFCFESSGTPSSFLDAPPWTFNSTLATYLTVTDAFVSGDRFSILDFNAPIAQTSVPTPPADCGDVPAVCLATYGMSNVVVLLSAGNHSLSIVPTASLGGGSAFLRVDEVPEPGAGGLVAFGLLSIIWRFFKIESRKERRR